jgi:hypothetical protein
MQTITKLLAVLIITLNVLHLQAQEVTVTINNSEKITLLNQQKEQIKIEERELLKVEVEAINQRLDNGEINQGEAEQLKKEAAQRRAANIENKLAIIDNKIALLERNAEEDLNVTEDDHARLSINLGNSEEEGSVFYFGRKRDKQRKYDRRTTTDLVLAIGFNNALIDGQNIDDSPYKLAGSGFVELGWAWKTRLLDNSNAVRLKYGISFMWNKLNIKDDMYIVKEDDAILLQEFPSNLKKAKFRTTNLVFPLHFEFGPSKKIDRENYFRYSTRNKFKLGVGGYVGFKLAALQKLKYSVDGRDVKDKFKGGYNTTDFVYGLSGYFALYDVAIYVKYDLSPIFKNQEIDQNNISIGLRFDMD